VSGSSVSTIFGVAETIHYYTNSTDYTPIITDISPKSGYHGKPSEELWTITGAPLFSKYELDGLTDVEDIVVMVGYERCTNVARHEDSGWDEAKAVHMITCEIPQHPAGVYPITYRHKGGFSDPRANGLYFNYESAVLDIQPPVGSHLGGQVITISGFGFAASEECTDEIDKEDVKGFDWVDSGIELVPEIIDYCYKNYTLTYNNDTYFKITCSALLDEGDGV